MPASSAAAAFKDAFFTAAQTLWAGTDVQVAFGRVTSEQETANFGTNRSREETLTIDVVFSMFRGGGPEQEKVASDRGYALLSHRETYPPVTDTTIRGTVRDCFLASHESDGSTDPQILAAGRLIEITATFQAKARVTS